MSILRVVEDASLVGNPQVRAKCRDRIVIGELLTLIDQFYDMGILFSKKPSIESINHSTGRVSGFKMTPPDDDWVFV